MFETKYIIIVLITGGLLFIGWQYIRTKQYITIGKQLVAETIPYEQHPQNPTQHILVIGDSSAVGVGASTSTLSVAGRIGTDFPTADITNRAVSGAKIHEIAEQLKDIEQRYDLIVIHAGGNDIAQFTPLDNVRKSLNTLLPIAEAKAPQVILLHGNDFGSSKLLPIGTRWAFSKRTKQMRDIFSAETANRPTQYIDILVNKDQDPFYMAPRKYYAADFFHPSEFGYEFWYKQIQPYLQNIRA